MNILPKWKGRIENGVLKIIDKDKFYRFLVNFEGKDIWCSVDRWKEISKRSLQQNKYLWGVVYKMISMETGHTVEEIHEIMKKKFLSKWITFNNKEEKITKSTTGLDKLDFMDYTDAIKIFAETELNLVIPDPNEIFDVCVNYEKKRNKTLR